VPWVKCFQKISIRLSSRSFHPEINDLTEWERRIDELEQDMSWRPTRGVLGFEERDLKHIAPSPTVPTAKLGPASCGSLISSSVPPSGDCIILSSSTILAFDLTRTIPFSRPSPSGIFYSDSSSIYLVSDQNRSIPLRCRPLRLASVELLEVIAFPRPRQHFPSIITSRRR